VKPFINQASGVGTGIDLLSDNDVGVHFQLDLDGVVDLEIGTRSHSGREGALAVETRKKLLLLVYHRLQLRRVK
jgi:hypothetical protein